jgi:hypothetical protein
MRIVGWLVLGAVLLAPGACGGGGGGGDDGPAGPPPALTGWWLEAWDEVDAHRAYAVEYDDGGIWTVLQILDPDAADLTYVWLGYQATPHIPAGTYDVGGANDEIDLQVHVRRESGYGVGGNVVPTDSSESRVAGWTIVTLSDGASVTGSFDVPIRASAPWRP